MLKVIIGWIVLPYAKPCGLHHCSSYIPKDTKIGFLDKMLVGKGARLPSSLRQPVQPQ